MKDGDASLPYNHDWNADEAGMFSSDHLYTQESDSVVWDLGRRTTANKPSEDCLIYRLYK